MLEPPQEEEEEPEEQCQYFIPEEFLFNFNFTVIQVRTLTIMDIILFILHFFYFSR